MNRVLTPALAREGLQHIAAVDKTLARVIAEHGAPKFPSRREPAFHALTVSLVNQCISKQAGDAVESRLAKLMPRPFTPSDALKVSAAEMRAAGLSWRKAECVRGLAERFERGMIVPSRFPRMTDAEVEAELVSLPGIGKWTAEMFMMFHLRRPDIVSLGDAGLLRAARNLYGARRRESDDAALLQKVSRKWRPFRTVASRLLWRSLH